MTNDMPEMPPSRPATRRIPLAIGAVAAVGVIGLGAFYGLGGFKRGTGGDPSCTGAVELARRIAPPVLIDGQGCEIGNLAGPAEWASEDAIKLIKAAMEPVKAGF